MSGTLDIGSTEVLPPGDNDEWYKSRYTAKPCNTQPSSQALFDDIVKRYVSQPSPYAHIVVVFNVGGQAYQGSTSAVTIDPLRTSCDESERFAVTGIAHEMLHGYGLNHPFDNSRQGEYQDPWDIMSADDVYQFTGFNEAPSGPEMNAPYKDWMRFLPIDRVLNLTPNSSRPQIYTVSLAALNRPEANGYLAVRIPLATTNEEGVRVLEDHALYVEFRQPSFWDRSIPQCAVLIHEYTGQLNETTGGKSSLLKVQGDAQWLPSRTFQQPLVTVAIQEVHGVKHQEDVLASTAQVVITC